MFQSTTNPKVIWIRLKATNFSEEDPIKKKTIVDKTNGVGIVSANIVAQNHLNGRNQS